MTILLLVMLFTGPMKEMPPALNATGVVAGDCVGVASTGVADDVATVVPVTPVVPVVPGEGCPLLPPTPEHAVINNIITRTTV
jgi:hypothetical protein